MIELFLIIVLLCTVADPKWLGQHLAKTRQWYDYYQREQDDNTRKDIIKHRAKNIKRIRQERFKNMP
jgi:hypothetical protein